MRFSDIVNPTARFGAVIYPSVRFGAVFRIGKSYGAVFRYDISCGRFGAVFRYSKYYGAALGAVIKSYGAVRCGSQLNGFCYGAGPIPVEKTV